MDAEGDANGSRLRIEETSDGVRIGMPGPRSRWAPLGLVLLVPAAAYLVFGSLILAGAAVETARSMGSVVGTAFVAVLLLIPVALDALALVALVVLLYHLWGRETVTATPWMLADTRGVLLFARRRRWPAMRVSNVRLAPMSGGPLDPRLLGRRGILLDVDGKRTRSIGTGLTPAEAAEAYAAITGALSRPTITR